jgi:hypothetical protein
VPLNEGVLVLLEGPENTASYGLVPWALDAFGECFHFGQVYEGKSVAKYPGSCALGVGRKQYPPKNRADGSFSVTARSIFVAEMSVEGVLVDNLIKK